MIKKLQDVCTGFTKNITQKELSENEGIYPIFGASGLIKKIDYYISDKPYIGIVKDGSGVGRANKYPAKSSLLGTMQYIIPNEGFDLDYLMFGIRSLQLGESYSGAAIPHIYFHIYKNRTLDFPDFQEQKKRSFHLNKIQDAIYIKENELSELENAIQSEFVEMFGDFSEYSKIQWDIKSFTEVAKIDGNMVNDFTKYADYPHIGIDSIEKNTGELKGYRTVKEDNVISGKYLFSPEHIIYSKIRPNLNKVAIPQFSGVCSADAYPILVDKTRCNRYYLAYLMRSEFFLTYILAFSSRAGMPKVNREQVNGFKLPVPPLELQNQFAAFVKQIDKSKFVVEQQIADLQELLDSKMDEYFA